MRTSVAIAGFVIFGSTVNVSNAAAQVSGAAVAVPAAPTAPAVANPGNAVAGITPPPGYVIGPDDQLSVIFWRDKDMTVDVVVRPDGMITLPLLNDIPASGLTPDELRLVVTKAATTLFEEPNVSVSVKQINSRKVFITGQVSKPGAYPLNGPMTVLQLITVAGGVLEYADAEQITVIRRENGKDVPYRVNYEDLKKRKNLQQNIELKPGDSIVVP